MKLIPTTYTVLFHADQEVFVADTPEALVKAMTKASYWETDVDAHMKDLARRAEMASGNPCSSADAWSLIQGLEKAKIIKLTTECTFDEENAFIKITKQPKL
tara:strand:- start:1624 stop:1929 length:306 start_codon:yes stop_codon:yes gene_type:complete